MKTFTRWKTTTALLTTIMMVCLPHTPVYAASAAESGCCNTDILQSIRTYTYYTYDMANKINANLTLALLYINEWLITPNASDKDDATGKLQADFSTYTNTILNTAAINNDLQDSLTREFLGSSVTPESVPYANDLTYQTLLGFPYFTPDPRIISNLTNPRKLLEGRDPARNYIANAAGLNIKHTLPNDDWSGSEEDKQKYKDFYNTITAIQTFNIHVLGSMYADYKNGGAASAQQASLIQQASNSGWFATVASEHIGLVLRQILMYNSQLLVVATQILETQKEQLAAQAMSNSLVVMGNRFNEMLLLNNAIGKQ